MKKGGGNHGAAARGGSAGCAVTRKQGGEIIEHINGGCSALIFEEMPSETDSLLKMGLLLYGTRTAIRHANRTVQCKNRASNVRVYARRLCWSNYIYASKLHSQKMIRQLKSCYAIKLSQHVLLWASSASDLTRKLAGGNATTVLSQLVVAAAGVGGDGLSRYKNRLQSRCCKKMFKCRGLRPGKAE